MTEFNTINLPQAVRKLFELNHYEVEGPVHLYGAEFDLVARPISAPFGVPIYIEVTIEYVDNAKYGKDVGKLSIISAKEPSAKKLIVSSRGFTAPVIERANASGIETLTYTDLFKRFERFEPYISLYLGQTSQPASCIKFRLIHVFTARNTGLSGRSSVWLMFTASEDKPHAVFLNLVQNHTESVVKRM